MAIYLTDIEWKQYYIPTSWEKILYVTYMLV